jgi:hypothetical protein
MLLGGGKVPIDDRLRMIVNQIIQEIKLWLVNVKTVGN